MSQVWPRAMDGVGHPTGGRCMRRAQRKQCTTGRAWRSSLSAETHGIRPRQRPLPRRARTPLPIKARPGLGVR
jgi:hypothetical protein